MKRFAKKTDDNQPEIVDALRKAGCVVFVIGRPFDLLVARDKHLCLMEVKNPEGRNKLSESQRDDIAELWFKGVRVHIVRSAEEAIAAVTEMEDK